MLYSKIAQQLGEIGPVGISSPIAIERSPVPPNVAPYEPRPDVTHDLTTSNDGGVLKEIRVAGSGSDTPSYGDLVQIRYVAYFSDGRVFDSTKGNALQFTLGKGEVIRGIEIGVASMTKGEVAIIVCRPEYAYGEIGNLPRILPGVTLVFEIEVCAWSSEDLSEEQDGSIRRRQLIQGNGYVSPRSGATVDIHLIGRHEGRIFDERDLTFALLDGDCNKQQSVPAGVQQALLRFTKGETSVLTLTSKQAFASQGSVQPEVPPNAKVEYEVTLLRFEKAGHTWHMETAEKLEQASLLKSKATDKFLAGRYAVAVAWYQKIVEYVDREATDAEDEFRPQCRDMKLAALLNVALCRLKLKEYCEAKEACDAALRIDDCNEKAFYRRGQAHLETSDYELSLRDFHRVLAIDPSNKAASNQIDVCTSKMKAAREKEKQAYGSMFAKSVKQDKRQS